MDVKKSKSKKLLRKLLNRYRMVVINEQTFEEQLQFRLSRLNVIIATIFLMSFFGVFVFVLIAFTPIKEFIPGYDSTVIRKKATENYLKADSLITVYEKNIQYLNSSRSVLSGEISFDDNSDKGMDSANNVPQKEYATTRVKEDSLLRALVAQEDKYNILEPAAENLNILLFPPANGPVSQAFDPERQHYAVDIVLEENTPIKSISEGVVVFAEYTAQTGYVIMIEHAPYGLLSVYKHNASLTKQQGDRVITGEVIATAGNTGEFSTGWHLHFELWMEGYPVDPSLFFEF